MFLSCLSYLWAANPKKAKIKAEEDIDVVNQLD
jgi:hypothetical protein